MFTSQGNNTWTHNNVRGCFCSDTQVLCSAAQWSLHPLGTKVQNCWDAWWTLPVHALPTHQLPSASSCQGEHEHVLFFFFFKGCSLKQVCSTCQHLDWLHLFNPCTLMQCFQPPSLDSSCWRVDVFTGSDNELHQTGRESSCISMLWETTQNR